MQASPSDDDLGAEFLRFTTIIEEALRPWVRDSIVDASLRCGEAGMRLTLLLTACDPVTSTDLIRATRRTLRACRHICLGATASLGPLQNVTAAEDVYRIYDEMRPTFEVAVKVMPHELADEGWELYEAVGHLMAHIAANCQLCPDQQAKASAALDALGGAMQAVVDQFAKGQRWAWIRQWSWSSLAAGKTFGFLGFLDRRR